jgi:carbon storage regulator
LSDRIPLFSRCHEFWIDVRSTLVLSRYIDEVVRIGNDIELRILAINGQQVRIGIDAPPTVVVDREEIAIRKQQERAPDLIPETSADAIAPEVKASDGRPYIRVAKRRIGTAAVQSSAIPLASPSTSGRRQKLTLRVASKSNMAGT